jgi:hypothetical protein
MNKAPLDKSESSLGVSRALTYARKLVEDTAKKGMPAADIAAELKRREEAHDAWRADVEKYHLFYGWWNDLTPEEKGSKIGQIAAQAIEQLGETLYRTKVVGY